MRVASSTRVGSSIGLVARPGVLGAALLGYGLPLADLISEVNKHENPAVNIENFASFIFGIALMLLIKTMLE